MTPRRRDDLTMTDLTSFIVTFQAERNSGGFFFDGLETGNQNIHIQISFNGGGVIGTLNNGNVLAPPPQVWLTRDTYWTVDNVNGLRYWKTGTPANYASAEDVTMPNV